MEEDELLEDVIEEGEVGGLGISESESVSVVDRVGLGLGWVSCRGLRGVCINF